MSRRGAIWTIVTVTALMAIAAAGKWAFDTLRYPLTIASPANYTFGDFGTRAARVLADERPRIRLVRTPVPDLESSAAALEAGGADLAVVRTDRGLPSNGQTLAMLGRDPAFLIVPYQSTIESFKDLKGKSIAVLETGIDETKLLDRLLEFYAVAPSSVQRVVMAPAAIGAALRQKKIVAVFAIASPSSAAATNAFAAVAKAGKGAPDIIGLPEAESIAKSFGLIEAGEIAVGAFAGASPAPEEAVPTIIVTYRMMARQGLPDMIAGELARILMVTKAKMLNVSPLAARIEAPDAETDPFPIHPGAKAFYNDEQTTVFDKIESVFWLGTALISVLGSLVAWVVSRFRGPDVDQRGANLLSILRAVREADEGALDGLEASLDDVVETLVENREDDEFGAEERATLIFAVGQVRAAIAKRREFLTAHPPTAAAAA